MALRICSRFLRFSSGSTSISKILSCSGSLSSLRSYSPPLNVSLPWLVAFASSVFHIDGHFQSSGHTGLRSASSFTARRDADPFFADSTVFSQAITFFFKCSSGNLADLQFLRVSVLDLLAPAPGPSSPGFISPSTRKLFCSLCKAKPAFFILHFEENLLQSVIQVFDQQFYNRIDIPLRHFLPGSILTKHDTAVQKAEFSSR